MVCEVSREWTREWAFVHRPSHSRLFRVLLSRDFSRLPPNGELARRLRRSDSGVWREPCQRPGKMEFFISLYRVSCYFSIRICWRFPFYSYDSWVDRVSSQIKWHSRNYKKTKTTNQQILQQFWTCIVDFVFRQGRVDWKKSSKNISTNAGLDTVTIVVFSVCDESKIRANQRLTSDNSTLSKFQFIISFSS